MDFCIFSVFNQLRYYLFCHSHGLIIGLRAGLWTLQLDPLSSEKCLVFLSDKMFQVYCQQYLPQTWIGHISGVLVPFSGELCLETKIWKPFTNSEVPPWKQSGSFSKSSTELPQYPAFPLLGIYMPKRNEKLCPHKNSYKVFMVALS